MSNLSDKVSYLRGLSEGMQLEESSNEGKLLKQIIGVLSEMTEKIDALEEAYDELSDYVESIDDDLEALEVRADEDEDFGDDDDGEFTFFDDDDDCDECDCEDCEECIADDEFGGMYAGCLCSECGGMFSIDVNFDEDQLFLCPHCNKPVNAIAMNCQNVPVAEATQTEDGEEE